MHVHVCTSSSSSFPIIILLRPIGVPAQIRVQVHGGWDVEWDLCLGAGTKTGTEALEHVVGAGVGVVLVRAGREGLDLGLGLGMSVAGREEGEEE